MREVFGISFWGFCCRVVFFVRGGEGSRGSRVLGSFGEDGVFVYRDIGCFVYLGFIGGMVG